MFSKLGADKGGSDIGGVGGGVKDLQSIGNT